MSGAVCTSGTEILFMVLETGMMTLVKTTTRKLSNIRKQSSKNGLTNSKIKKIQVRPWGTFWVRRRFLIMWSGTSITRIKSTMSKAPIRNNLAVSAGSIDPFTSIYIITFSEDAKTQIHYCFFCWSHHRLHLQTVLLSATTATAPTTHLIMIEYTCIQISFDYRCRFFLILQLFHHILVPYSQLIQGRS